MRRPLLLLALLAICGCKTGARVTPSLCDDWIGHYGKLSDKALAPELARCHVGSGPAKRGREIMLTMCKHNVDQPYDEKEASCFMSAKSADDWSGCTFGAASMFHGLATGVQNERDMLDQTCAK